MCAYEALASECWLNFDASFGFAKCASWIKGVSSCKITYESGGRCEALPPLMQLRHWLRPHLHSSLSTIAQSSTSAI